jgi:hypothetical protein
MTAITSETIERRVRLSRKWGIILALVLGAVTAIIRTNLYFEASGMLTNGVATQATIIEKRHWVEEGRKGREHDRYGFTYQFSDSNGVAYTREIGTSEEIYDQTSEGGPIDIIYSASDSGLNDTRMHYERNASIEKHVKDVLTIMAFFIIGGFVIGFLVNNKMKKMLAAQASTGA